MSKHTPEPWTIGAGSHVCGMWSGMIRVESPEDFHSNGIDYPDGSTRSFTNVVCGTTGHSETARENMLRIVACVNAMAGIPDPAAFVERAKRIEDAARDLIGCWQDDISPLTNPIERLITALETNP